jgi:SAM-dependent methyltransferase
MKTPGKLTDRACLERNRKRARQMENPALFMQEEAAIEIDERLNQVNRTFKSPAVVTSFPEIWKNILPGAVFIEDRDVLELEVGAHDLVIHSLSLHWANDPVGQMIQCHRALVPDGLFIGAGFGGQTLHELRTCLSEAEIALTGGLSPRVVPMGEIREMGALLQRAGFALPVADTFAKTVVYRDAWHLMRDLRAMGEGNALELRRKTIPPRALFEVTNDIYGRNFALEDGRITATFELVFLTGWAPDASQQQPLKPGSAVARLADALGTGETEL